MRLATPKVIPLQTLTVPAADGKVSTEFGITVGTADITWFDGQMQTILTKYAKIITPTSLPIFITYDSYLTEGECCIGGYHSSYGSTAAPQAYSHFTYISTPGIFSQDVSALSHEVGEWLDDPLVVNTNGNPVSCGILEVGDPEEGFTKMERVRSIPVCAERVHLSPAGSGLPGILRGAEDHVGGWRSRVVPR